MVGAAALAAEAPSSRYGGTLVFASMGDPKSFNPVLAQETSTTMVTSFLFEGLTRINAETLAVEPNLAERWEMNETGREWTFFLRPGVRWNDGQLLTADDVVFTFNHLIYNDAIPSSSRDIFSIKGQVFKVEKVNDLTVRFILPEPFAPFLRAMAQEILPRHKLESVVDQGTFSFHWGVDAAPSEVVGTGPFRLARYQPGERVRLERNPFYWRRSASGDALPYLDGVVILILQNQDAMVLKFLEGELDYCVVRGGDYPILKPLEAERGFTIFEAGADFGSNFLVFNQNTRKNPATARPFVAEHKQRWFRDVRFRQAVAHAIDKVRMIDIVKNGLGYRQESALSPSAGFYYNPNVTIYGYDLARARKLLAEAGYRDRDGDGVIEDGDGTPVEFNLYTNAGNIERERIAAMIRHDLGQIGMRVNYIGLEFNALIQKLNATYDWDAVILGLTGGIEPHFGRNVWHSSGQLHLWNPAQTSPYTAWEMRIDDIFDAGVRELDEARRKALYDEWQVIAADKVPLIYTILGVNMFAVRNRFGNLQPTSYGGAFHNIEEIYVTEQQAGGTFRNEEGDAR